MQKNNKLADEFKHRSLNTAMKDFPGWTIEVKIYETIEEPPSAEIFTQIVLKASNEETTLYVQGCYEEGLQNAKDSAIQELENRIKNINTLTRDEYQLLLKEVYGNLESRASFEDIGPYESMSITDRMGLVNRSIKKMKTIKKAINHINEVEIEKVAKKYNKKRMQRNPKLNLPQEHYL